MPELILHAGAPKTGTSMLQVLFARHSEELARSGILYPRGHLFDEAAAGYITSGNGMAMAKHIRPELPHDVGDPDAFIDDLARELSQADGRHVLYSSEYLVFDPADRAAAIAAVASKNGYTPRVIFLVRDIGAAFLAAYSQKVKRAGECRPFPEFILTWELPYRLRLEQACRVFGRERVEVYSYEERRRELVEFFFRTLLGANFIPPENPLVNRSLSGKEAELLRSMNAAIGGDPAIATFLSDALMNAPSQTPTEPMVLTRDEAVFLEKKYGADLAYINGMVRGRPCAVASVTTEHRKVVELTDFERATAALLAKLAAVVMVSRTP